MAAAIRARQLSPVDLIDAVLDRIERVNPKLNAFYYVAADEAREEARWRERMVERGELLGALHGLPVSIKDLNHVKSMPTTFGSKFFADHVSQVDDVLVLRLKAAGAIIIGKTAMPHFGHKDMCDNLLKGVTRNPWRLDRTSGASSGGAGAATAAGLGPLAHGSDGAGSIRIPSALCGVFGLKPSFGRVPFWPNNDYWNARPHNGPMTRTVVDAALMLQVIAGPDERDPLSIDGPVPDFGGALAGDLRGLRVAFSVDLGYAAVDSQVRRIATNAARRFRDFGCSYDEVNPSWQDPGSFHKQIYEASQAARQAERVAEHPEWIEPSLMEMIENGRKVTVVELGQTALKRSAFYDEVRRFFRDYDLLLTPTMLVVAWSVDHGPTEIDGRPTPTMFDRLPFTFPFNLTGQPAASVPAGWNAEGLPVGLQIVGRWHRDDQVLRAAACFEQAAPWTSRRPQL